MYGSTAKVFTLILVMSVYVHQSVVSPLRVCNYVSDFCNLKSIKKHRTKKNILENKVFIVIKPQEKTADFFLHYGCCWRCWSVGL